MILNEENDEEKLYRVGYGYIKDFDTIMEKEIAVCFNYYFAKKIGEMESASVFSPRIYFIDECNSQGECLQRYIYASGSSTRDEWVKGEEVISGKYKVYMRIYTITSTIYYEDDEYDQDFTHALSYDKAESIKEEFIKEGASEVDIDDAFEDITKYVFDAEKFMLGEKDKSRQISNEQDFEYGR